MFGIRNLDARAKPALKNISPLGYNQVQIFLF
jgi:hypothetical protein